MKYVLSKTNVSDLIEWLRNGHIDRVVRALENLNPVKTNLEQPVQPEVEPVAWIEASTGGDTVFIGWEALCKMPAGTKIYIHPPAPTALAALSDSELQAVYADADGSGFAYEELFQKAFCIKNGLTLEGGK